MTVTIKFTQKRSKVLTRREGLLMAAIAKIHAANQLLSKPKTEEENKQIKKLSCHTAHKSDILSRSTAGFPLKPLLCNLYIHNYRRLITDNLDFPARRLNK